MHENNYRLWLAIVLSAKFAQRKVKVCTIYKSVYNIKFEIEVYKNRKNYGNATIELLHLH